VGGYMKHGAGALRMPKRLVLPPTAFSHAHGFVRASGLLRAHLVILQWMLHAEDFVMLVALRHGSISQDKSLNPEKIFSSGFFGI